MIICVSSQMNLEHSTHDSYEMWMCMSYFPWGPVQSCTFLKFLYH